MCASVLRAGACVTTTTATTDRHLDYWISCVIATEPP